MAPVKCKAAGGGGSAWTPISWDNIVVAGGAAASSTGNGQLKKTAGTANWEVVAYSNTQFAPASFPVMLRFKVAEPSSNTIFDIGFADAASNNLSSASLGFQELAGIGNFAGNLAVYHWDNGGNGLDAGNFDSGYYYMKVSAAGVITTTHSLATIRTYTSSAAGKTVIPFIGFHGIPATPEILESAYCTLGASCPEV